ncbi:MAG: bifunctional AP-4-A phosphorylase/ADP sulfurylase [Trichoglossum hirsutum]|nr:MAG: bifunctional AP-4-A phosphorylase/ADP sulfurylase [Trichoglossum hirsutum]
MQHLRCAVKKKYCSALSGGHLTFSPTHLAIIHINGVPFQLRYCPALSKKPQHASSSTAQTTDKPNPFLNPSNDLLVAQIPSDEPTHNIVINKYPVIPHHFILSTVIFKPQVNLLEEQDLGAAYSCLKEWEVGTSETTNSRKPRLFAFFNSGEHSGASQPHRHIQFLPVEDIAADQESDGWSLLADDIFSGPGVSDRGEFSSLPILLESLLSRAGAKPDSPTMRSHRNIPFVHFASPMPSNPSPSDLHRLYMSLYKNAVDAVRAHVETKPDDDLKVTSIDDGSAAVISYNLALTTESMVLCPRRRGRLTLEVKQTNNANNRMLGPIELNGTVLAGTLMVKRQDDWDELRSGQKQTLQDILTAIGIPRNQN